MGTRVKFAQWRKEGKLYRVKPPGWPRHCELSFTDQNAMQEWAKAAHVMLRDDNPPKRDERRNNGRFAARNFG